MNLTTANPLMKPFAGKVAAMASKGKKKKTNLKAQAKNGGPAKQYPTGS